MSNSLKFSLLITATIFQVSCEGPENMESPVSTAEGAVVVEHLGRPSPEMSSALKKKDPYPVFSAVVLERGYRVLGGEAECFKGTDPSTGQVVYLTMIPCILPDDRSRVAFIHYFESGDRWIVNAAEYLEEEDYSIPHPLDEEAYARSSGDRGTPKAEHGFLRSESSGRYWSCVTKRFAAGCAGCATVCLLSGPGWGACTAKCCAGSAVVALISCAFTVYMGW